MKRTSVVNPKPDTMTLRSDVNSFRSVSAVDSCSIIRKGRREKYLTKYSTQQSINTTMTTDQGLVFSCKRDEEPKETVLTQLKDNAGKHNVASLASSSVSSL